MSTFDLAEAPLRELNAALHSLSPSTNETHWVVTNPGGKHAIACGVDAPVTIDIEGHVGYYCGGMNKEATIVVSGNAGVGVAKNMMSGEVRVKGGASQAAGATGRGGLLVIDGNAAARCGISMKGIDIVEGSIGPMSAFMAQAGNLVGLGDAGDALGDSICEARLFVRGSVASLGADCIDKAMSAGDKSILKSLLNRADLSDSLSTDEIKLFGSARRLYYFHVDNVDAY
ncbi:protein glxC [Bradyrhizobium arachidis]|uniref:Protein glxC n=1 Tax=Bradyrhizobium arachidis TaxID=858423 RepID=A0AAE7NWT8_9BRAD|nr:protein glxC [Bradyrhizobium arachidis]QOZ73257.1 protein glxC [Bradyrhizobium arachidis]SFV17438.1 N-methylglutamate synthase subunit B [Bradyrhizobium arachidis]